MVVGLRVVYGTHLVNESKRWNPFLALKVSLGGIWYLIKVLCTSLDGMSINSLHAYVIYIYIYIFLNKYIYLKAARKRHLTPGDGVTKVVSCPVWVLETERVTWKSSTCSVIVVPSLWHYILGLAILKLLHGRSWNASIFHKCAIMNSFARESICILNYSL